MTRDGVDALLDVQRRSYARAGPGLLRSWPQADAMARDGLASFLEEARYGVLATARPDGRPHAAPVAFSFEEKRFWVATVEGVRLRNLRSTPWASLVVSEGQGEETHRALTVEGATTLHEAGAFRGVREWLDRRWSERHSHAPDWAVAFVELKPERVFSHDPRADA